MTDLILVVVTLAAFVGLAALVGALDRAARRSTHSSDR